MMSTKPNSTPIRVTTYNVLSSHLGGADYYTSCKPEWLDPAYRFRQLKSKLDAEIDKEAIICLQEVSTLWGGSLYAYFANKGYVFVNTNYGNKFNGYMGVGIAVPRHRYVIEDVDITRIADTKMTVRQPKPPVILQLIKSWLIDPTIRLLRSLSILKPYEGTPWEMALNRHNQMLSIRLRAITTNNITTDDASVLQVDNTANDVNNNSNVNSDSTLLATNSNQSFVVGTYHMPCMFKLPGVMLIHTALSAQHIQRYSKGDPYLFLGDFNFKPRDTTYKLVTTGKVDSAVSEYTTFTVLVCTTTLYCPTTAY